MILVVLWASVYFVSSLRASLQVAAFLCRSPLSFSAFLHFFTGLLLVRDCHLLQYYNKQKALNLKAKVKNIYNCLNCWCDLRKNITGKDPWRKDSSLYKAEQRNTIVVWKKKLFSRNLCPGFEAFWEIIDLTLWAFLCYFTVIVERDVKFVKRRIVS